MCRLRHTEMRDAAHIVDDRDVRGKPKVPDGLALCRIHHGAFDANTLGISPDYPVHIRADILKEKMDRCCCTGFRRWRVQRSWCVGRKC